MSLQAIGGNIYAPDYPGNAVGAPTFSTSVVDADAEGYGIIFQAPVTGTITGFGTCTGTLTTGDAATDFRLESVTTSATPAVPSGSLIAANTNVAVNVNASNTWFNGVLTASYSATQGELLAAIVQRPASGSLNTQFRLFQDDSGGTIGTFPYAVVKTGASWTFPGLSPIFAINYGGTYYHIRGSWPYSAITTTAFSSSSTPDIIGNIWIPTVKCRVVGVWFWSDLDAGTLIKFYDTDGVTVLATATVVANTRSINPNSISWVPFDDTAGATSVTPTVGATYRIGIEPSSGTNISVYDFTVNAAAIMGAFGLGTNMYKTSAKNPTGTGDWTNVTTRRVFLGVIIDQFDDGVQTQGGNWVLGSGVLR